MSGIGVRFAKAVAARDADTLTGMLAETVDFRGMSPDTVFEGSTAAEVVDVLLGQWFDNARHMEGLDSVGTSSVGDRERVGCRVRVSDSDGTYEAEIQAFFSLDGEGRIAWLRIMSSGLRPVGTAEAHLSWHLWSTRTPLRPRWRARTDNATPRSNAS